MNKCCLVLLHLVGVYALFLGLLEFFDVSLLEVRRLWQPLTWVDPETHWASTRWPNDEYVKGGARAVRAVSTAIDVQVSGLPANKHEPPHGKDEFPPFDDMVFTSADVAYATGLDGFLWKLSGLEADAQELVKARGRGDDVATKEALLKATAERFVAVPGTPMGIRTSPTNPDLLFVTAARYRGQRRDALLQTYREAAGNPPESHKHLERYEADAGLFVVNLKTKEVEPLLTRLPIEPQTKADAHGTQHEHDTSSETWWRPAVVDPDCPDFGADLPLAGGTEGTRAFGIANDIAVSDDGAHIYITESTDRQDAAMGPEGPNGYRDYGLSHAMKPEGVLLLGRGAVWRLDVDPQTAAPKRVSVVATGLAFVNGIVIGIPKPEAALGAIRYPHLLVTEQNTYRILRIPLAGTGGLGPKRDLEIVHKNTPGMPDALTRDEDGRIWVAFPKIRYPGISIFHSYAAWTKPIFMRLPDFFLPLDPDCAIGRLTADGEEVDFFAIHDGSGDVAQTTSVTPQPGADGRLFLSSFRARAAQPAIALPRPPAVLPTTTVPTGLGHYLNMIQFRTGVAWNRVTTKLSDGFVYFLDHLPVPKEADDIPVISHQQAIDRVKTGDLVFWGGTFGVSVPIRWVSKSPYSHISLIIRGAIVPEEKGTKWEDTPRLLQATWGPYTSAYPTTMGETVQRQVMLNDFAEVLHENYMDVEPAAVRFLQVDDEERARLHANFSHFINTDAMGKEYPGASNIGVPSPVDYIRALLGLSKVETGAYFCSEVVSAAYQKAGILNDEFAAATWTPAEFTDGYNPEKYDAGFNPGYVLTPENAIRNTKKGEVKQADKDKKIKARRAASGDRTGLGK